MNPLARLPRFFSHHFQLCPYGLAMMRMGLALAIIVDMIERLNIFDVISSERGIFPTLYMEAASAAMLQGLPWLPNVYFLTPSDAAQKFWIVCQLFLAFALLLGVGGRAVLVLLLYLVCCSNLRMLTTLKGGDVILPWMILLNLCLPVTQVWAWKKVSAQASRFRTAACFFYVFMLYHAAGMLKTDPVWWNGNAIGRALNSGIVTTAFGEWLSQFEQVLTFFSPLVPASEIAFPLLLFIPHRYVRLAVCLFFLSFHLGMGFSLRLGNLTVLMMSFWVGLVPPEFFQNVRKWFARSTTSREGSHTSSREPVWIGTVSAVLLIVTGASLAMANVGLYRQDPELQKLSAEFRLYLLGGGVRGDMSFYRSIARGKHWLRFVAHDMQGVPRFFNLFLDRWEGSAHDNPPADYTQEVVPTRRSQGLYDCLVLSKCSAHFSQIQKTLCLRARDPSTNETPARVEAIAYAIMFESGELRKRVVFTGECTGAY